MEIRLIRTQREGPEKIPLDRIVSVKVLERKGGEAKIDVNGTVTRAKLEADVPDHFLARTEKTPDGNWKLRVVSPAKDDPSFTVLAKEKLQSNLKEFLLANNVPVNRETLATAGMMRSKGMALEPASLRMMLRLSAMHGENFARVLAAMLGGGLTAPADFPELLKRMPEWLRLLLDSSGEDDGRTKEAGKRQTAEQPLDAWNALLERYMPGLESWTSWKEKSPEGDWLVQFRRYGRENGKIWVFDLSETDGDRACLSANQWPDGWDLRLELSPALFGILGPEVETRREALVLNLRKLAGSDLLTLAISKSEDEWISWDHPQSGKDKPEAGMMDLDISV